MPLPRKASLTPGVAVRYSSVTWNLDKFHFELPAEQIAQQPLADRSASRLLFVSPDGNACKDLRFSDLGNLVESGDLLVMNDTKVIPARLVGCKTSGGRVEMLLERQLDTDLALVQLKANRAPAVGGQIEFEGGTVATVVERRDGFFVLRFSHPVDRVLNAVRSRSAAALYRSRR